MGGSYRQCGECGKRALSIATRCPGCGRELEPQATREARQPVEVGRYLPKGVTVAVAVMAVVLAVELGGDGLPSGSPTTARPAPADSMTEPSEVAYALGATTRLDTASVEATPAGGVLVAKTWTNVRRSRSRRAELEAVLTPGDSVFADSLQRDWYRVAYEGEVMGYAHRSTLTSPRN